MHIDNSVKAQTRPWFMDESLIAPNVSKLDAEVRPHVESVIEDGFAVIRHSIAKERCAQLIQEFKRLVQLNPDKFQRFLDKDGHYPRIVNLHAALPDLFELFSSNTLAYQVQQALFGATPCLYTSLFYERGSAQSAHRDTPFFATRPEYFYLGVWVALEDADHENGALQVIRGGHKLPELRREEMALKRFSSLKKLPSASDELWMDYQSAVVRQCEDAGLQLESICVEAGDTVIWHPQLPHGGGPIRDLTKSRFSFVMHTTPVGVPVYHQDKFFNPTADAPIDASWEYEQVGGAYRVIHREVNFAHQESFPVRKFKLPPTQQEVAAEAPRSGRMRLLRRMLR